jgi:hypothetical protein
MAHELKRGDIMVFPPRVIESRGKHRRSELDRYEGTGEYEVCGTMLADGVMKVFCADESLTVRVIHMHFMAEVNTLEWV